MGAILQGGSGTRAWIELDPDALSANVASLRSRLPEGCQLMPAVKANAYGHGAVLIAGMLNRLGVRAFCTACAEEGVELRKAGIQGEILILGYTHPDAFPLLSRYGLTQTVVDYPYALLLQEAAGRSDPRMDRYRSPEMPGNRPLPETGCRFHVHIGIDTGMHRLGIPWNRADELAAVFRMSHLQVDALFTHLCVSEAHTPREDAFTRTQAEAFYSAVDELKRRGFPCPRLHLLSSYGLMNYPDFAADYVRTGISLYGMLSTTEDTEKSPLPLRPVLSLKARIASVRELACGESAGYGLAFTANRPCRIAVLAIGYADGLPRSLSCGAGYVLIRGQRAPVVGRICMDQTLVDVTNIPSATAGDVAVLIGSSGAETITACDLAAWTGTIANEILSRLGARLERFPVSG